MEHSWVLAIEQLMNVSVPARAQYIRVLFSEITRIMNHLLAVTCHAMGEPEGDRVGRGVPVVYPINLWDLGGGLCVVEACGPTDPGGTRRSVMRLGNCTAG